tara:strand:+ start:1038 stop:1337 length:300 start_codon:yes stop_codon:yes gene_type:complete
MEKFLSIPVTNEGNQLVPLAGLKLIEVGGTPATETTMTYGNGKVITITHATVGAASATNSGTQFRTFLQDNAVLALATSWTNPSFEITPLYAVSGIDIA